MDLKPTVHGANGTLSVITTKVTKTYFLATGLAGMRNSLETDLQIFQLEFQTQCFSANQYCTETLQCLGETIPKDTNKHRALNSQ